VESEIQLEEDFSLVFFAAVLSAIYLVKSFPTSTLLMFAALHLV
jgi:hypothetical protein